LKRLMVAAALVAVLGGMMVHLDSGVEADARLVSCDDWVNDTNDRVNDARKLLYPSDRPDAFQGSAQEASRGLLSIAQEQQQSDYPDGAGAINDDLIEALTIGADGLAGGSDATTEVVFAKAIVYNADARLLALANTC